MPKEYDGDLIFLHHWEYNNVIYLKFAGDTGNLASLFTFDTRDDWKISDCEEKFSFLFKGLPRCVSRYRAMRKMLRKIDSYIKKFNPEGIDNKVYYVVVHENEHMTYTTSHYFSYK